MLIAEEAAFIEPEVFSKIIAPLLLVNSSSLLCITTPDGKLNAYFEKVISDPRPTDPSKTLFKQEHIELVCPGCKKRGVAGECKHSRGLIPAWFDSDRQLLSAALIPDEATRNRELRGIATHDNGYCFTEKKIKEIWAKPRLKLNKGIPRHVFFCIDTCTGTHNASAKTQSKFALLTAISQGRKGFIVVGGENIDAHKPSDYFPQLISHIQKVRLKFPHSIYVCIIESNLGQDAGWIMEKIYDHGVRDIIFMQDAELKTGVRTSGTVKRNMMLLTQELIDMEGDENLSFCSDEEFITSAKTPAVIQDELQKQLFVFSEIKTPGKEEHDAVKVKYSGKLMPGVTDDLAVVFQLLVFWARDFYANNKYKKYW